MERPDIAREIADEREFNELKVFGRKPKTTRTSRRTLTTTSGASGTTVRCSTSTTGRTVTAATADATTGTADMATVAMVKSSTGTPLFGNTFTMPLGMNSSAYGNEDTVIAETLLLDSGAAWCMCPEHYVLECPVESLPDGRAPSLVAPIVGDPMTVNGSARVHYTSLDLPQRLLDYRALPCLRHSIVSGQRRRTMPLRVQSFVRLPTRDPASARASPR